MKTFLQKLHKAPRNAVVFGGVLIFAAIGTILLVSSHAATPTASFEAEAGTRSGNASTVSDSTASSSTAVKFSATATALKGWQLDETKVGLAQFGLTCDSLPAFNDSTLSKRSGNYVIPAGTTIYRQRLAGGEYDLSAGNITIDQSCIEPPSGTVGLGEYVLGTWYGSPQGPVVLKDSECSGEKLQKYEQAWISCFVGTASFYRDYIHHFGSGIITYSTYEATGADVVIEGNYVRYLTACGNPDSGSGSISTNCDDMNSKGNHQSAYTVRGLDTSVRPNRQLIIRNNYFNCDGRSCSGVLFMQPNDASISNATISGNLLAGDGYDIYMDYDAGRFPGFGYSGVMVATDNRLAGPDAAYVRPGSGGFTQWSENYMYNASATDGKGTVVAKP